MNTNMFILFILISLLFLAFLMVQKKLSKSLKNGFFIILCFTIFISLYVVEFSEEVNVVLAKELLFLTSRNTNTYEKEMFIDRKENVLLDAPLIRQLPELPRGCEVTSLAMLLQFAGVDVDKMTLAQEIKKDTTQYKEKDGKIYYGHPNEGFVGDMYSYNQPGLGVYHKPIAQLAGAYLPKQIIDLTGSSFQQIEKQLSSGKPVWAIVTSTFKKLPKQQFITWHTPKGEIDITYSEHSVLITGYDNEYIYVNDPLADKKNSKLKKHDFIESWTQMGSQAITYIK